MKVTIITTCYNSERTIGDTLESVRRQNYSNIEHIIVDGGSHDGTLNIINKFPHISKVISESDDGIYDAANKGLLLSTGEIVGMLNSDDFFSDDQVVSRIVKSFKTSKNEIVFSDVDFVDQEDTNLCLRHYSSKLFRAWMFRFGFQPAHPTFYTYLNNFKKYGFYRTDLRIAADFELLLRFIAVNHLSYTYIQDSWVKMRMGGASTSGVRSVIRINSEILQACALNGVFTNKILIYSKYLIKWWGFLSRRN